MRSENSDHLATFSARREVETDMGGTVSEWVPQFEAWASVRYLRGGEAVMQARLASRNPVVVTIRNSADARLVTSEWQVSLRSRSGVTKVYAVKEDPRPSAGDSWLEFLAEG